MKRNLPQILTALLFAVLAGGSPLGAVTTTETLFGITFGSNNLVAVDQVTGVATVIGPLGGTSSPYGIAEKNNRLYTFDQTTNRIREINKISGAYSRNIDITVSGLKGEGDLAFRPSDGIGFLVSALNGNSEPTNDFYTFTITDNTDVGTAVRLGSTGVPIDALAFSSNGTLYGLGQTNATLYTINTTTGLATAVGSLGINVQSPIAGMAFSPSDELYAAIDDRLYRINTSSGAATTVSTVLNFSPLISSVSGLAFAPGAGTLGNMSGRVSVGAGERAGIVGFIIQGTPNKTVVLRGLGPSLNGITNRLADPTLDLYNSQGQKLATNDDFGSSTDKQAISDFGLAPGNAKEAAILRSLPAGSYTSILRGNGAGTGVGLVEIYDVDTGSGSTLDNLSVRGFVDVGENALIGGLIVSGSAAQRIVLRGIGPSLANFGVNSPLSDPNLSIYDANGTLLKFNDNYTMDPDAAEIFTRGFSPPDNREAATLATLAPGRYTAIVRGAGTTSGIALVESFNITDNP